MFLSQIGRIFPKSKYYTEGKTSSPTFSCWGALHHQHQHRADGHKPPGRHPIQRPRPAPVRPRFTHPRRQRGAARLYFTLVTQPRDPGATAGTFGAQRIFGSHWSTVLFPDGGHLQAPLGWINGIWSTRLRLGKVGPRSPWARRRRRGSASKVPGFGRLLQVSGWPILRARAVD